MKRIYDKVDRWTNAKKAVNELQHSLGIAEHELNDASNDLGTSMTPNDNSQINENETFNVWVRESNLTTAKEGLLTVRYQKGSDTFSIYWRQKPA